MVVIKTASAQATVKQSCLQLRQQSQSKRQHQISLIVVLLLLLFLSLLSAGQWPTLVAADWDSWWTYEGISGPDFWGRLNPKWAHCSKGRRQSPVNIDPDRLIYDPFLPEVTIKGDSLDGILLNTGRSISIVVLNGITDQYHLHQSGHGGHHHHQGHQGHQASHESRGSISAHLHPPPSKKPILISGGPLSYAYTLSNVTLHFGRENNRGSEHSIAGQQFAGELQLYAFNGQLYSNWSEARRSPNGLVALAVMIKVTKGGNSQLQLKHITSSLANITNRGDQQALRSVPLRDLLPADTRHFITYSGSLTQPACFETVTWIVLNRPIYLSAGQLQALRSSSHLKSDGHQGDNYRPVQPLNGRLLRSNINSEQHFPREATEGSSTFKYNLMHSHSSEEEDDERLNTGSVDKKSFVKESSVFQPASSLASSAFSKDLCYVNRPVAYKMNVREMELDF